MSSPESVFEYSPGFARGACYCGAVQFRVRLPVKWCAHCHCSICRRIHGAALVTWFGVEASAFSCTDEQAVRWYASSEKAQRGSCRHCGSQLFFRSERWPTECHIALVAMQDDIGLLPQAHVYCADAVSWLQCADKLPHFAQLSGSDA